MVRVRNGASGLVLLIALFVPLTVGQSFVHWESPHVHPLELTPDGGVLLAVNTADHRLEVFDVGPESLTPRGAIPVGLDPVSVRARTATEVWVVNQISDSVSVVDLVSMSVVATVQTGDEPADVVFAGSPERAFVTSSAENRVLVFDPTDLAVPTASLVIAGEEPRALAVSPDRRNVYVAMFESGNGTTLLGGGFDPDGQIQFPPDIVSHPSGPYGGLNPPPNSDDGFEPSLNPDLPTPPPVGLIVRKGEGGSWLDDNGTDWSRFVSGADAQLSGRIVGWDLLDHDLAVIDTTTLEVSYVSGLMNVCMSLATNPATGRVTVVGTDAINEVRFEPNLRGRFLRVLAATVDVEHEETTSSDLNPHLDYVQTSLPVAERMRAMGDPRGLVWEPSGERGWVVGFGSQNIVAVDPLGRRLEVAPIRVGAGPSGATFDAVHQRLYVLNRFDASISVVDPEAAVERARMPFFDPTPQPIRAGRPLLYFTQATSGTGYVSCASCHVDARTDRLAWDLGNPAGERVGLRRRNLGMGIPPLVESPFTDYHPMKGPMLTQTLQDIIGKEPFHWRGDRDGIEDFGNAYVTLLGRNEPPSDEQLQQLEAYLASIYYPPNPYRELDNSLPTDLPLAGHRAPGRFAPPGEPLPNGDARRGLTAFRPPRQLDGILACSTCHSLPTGMSTDSQLREGSFVPIPPGPNGEHHHGLVALTGVSTGVMKVPHLRGLYDRVGFDAARSDGTAGFGFNHDGGMDTLARFVADPSFSPADLQELADLVALLLAFTGSEFPGEPLHPLEAPGTSSLDTHAAVGRQVTVTDETSGERDEILRQLVALADGGAIGLVARRMQQGAYRGYAYMGSSVFQSDRTAERMTLEEMQSGLPSGTALTVTAVPVGSERRIGIDRDGDGFLDRDEVDAGSDPADAESVPDL